MTGFSAKRCSDAKLGLKTLPNSFDFHQRSHGLNTIDEISDNRSETFVVFKYNLWGLNTT